MLSDSLSQHILTVGCKYNPPTGGIAQVIYNYSLYVFPRFKCVSNSDNGNSFYKAAIAAWAVLQTGWKLITDHSINIVHIHTASYNSFRRSYVFLRLARVFGKKVVLHIHGGAFKDYYETKPTWIAAALNKCDVIITLSQSWQVFFTEITNGPKVCVVENIVAPPADTDATTTSDNNLCHLLFLGDITQPKGIFDLLDVLAQHADEFNSKLVLHVAGNGNLNEMHRIIKQHSLHNIVSYEGFVSGQKKANLLKQCSALILPSHTEGLPVSILEAMSYGKPVLATAVGGIPEVVHDGVNGILLSPGDNENLYHALKFALDNPAQLQHMGQRALQAVQPYLPDNVCQRLSNIYNSLL